MNATQRPLRIGNKSFYVTEPVQEFTLEELTSFKGLFLIYLATVEKFKKYIIVRVEDDSSVEESLGRFHNQEGFNLFGYLSPSDFLKHYGKLIHKSNHHDVCYALSKELNASGIKDKLKKLK